MEEFILIQTKNLVHVAREYKYKVCLIGGQEIFKNEFQEKMSSLSLSVENKTNIGVNISKITSYSTSNESLEIFLWNIDCSRNFASFRTVFYRGSEAIIVFISETKVEQIQQYLNEIKLRMPLITIIFCVILDKFTKEEVVDVYFKDHNFRTMLESNDIKINSISDPFEMIDQITSNLIYKINTKQIDDHFIIDFMQKDDLFNQDLHDNCCNYHEPPFNENSKHKRNNAKLLKDYLCELGFLFDRGCNGDWIKFRNDKIGTFSIFLRNGAVYLIPKTCEMCSDEKRLSCPKFQNAPYFICIEAETKGWSNIHGLEQSELLLLSKILALKAGLLPKDVVKQIKRINKCEK